MFPPVQAVRSPNVHVALGVQQAPVGWTHVAAAQVAAEAWKVPGHRSESVSAHVPSEKQHAAFTEAWHGLGVHDTPTAHDEMPVHPEYVVEAQLPLVSLQHAPFIGCGHGLGGPHEVFVPQLFGTAHDA